MRKLLAFPLIAVACGGAPAPEATVESKLINPDGLPDGEACAAHAECASDACSYAGVCVARRSCTAYAGGATCGPGEPGGEDCCTSIVVDPTLAPFERTLLHDYDDAQPELPLVAPSEPYALDKFVITSGRMRAFIERTGGDVRSFVASLGDDPRWRPEWTDGMPGNMAETYDRLGPFGYSAGCWMMGEGARTYWMPDDVNAAFPDSPHPYPQDVLDTKAIQCVDALMLQAFCIWDGGRLATLEELEVAWGPATYPWGEDAPSEENAVNGFNYAYPDDRLDNTAYIAAPGRRPAGNGPFGHADLGGLVFQLTSTFDPGGASVAWSRAGSWEDHPVAYPAVLYRPADVSRYWAAGGRCTYLP